VSIIGDGAFAGASLTSVTIPNSITEIGPAAFARCTGLMSVTIPNSVKVIGYAAFQECSNLTSVNIPSGVTKIEAGTFALCTKLTSVTIPRNVKNIGFAAFQDCPNLTSVTSLNPNPPIIENGVAFDFNIVITPTTPTLYVPASALNTYRRAESWRGFAKILPAGI